MDDEPDTTDSFSLALEDTGVFEVETYNDPLEALSNFKSNSYNFVFLDIKMPKMSGFELCGRIKKLDGKVKVCSSSSACVLTNLTRIRYYDTTCSQVRFVFVAIIDKSRL